jgi:high-affinity Fe2+/Pb2+ permease
MPAPTQPKVKAASAGAGISGAVTAILMWIVGLLGLDVPPEIASAFTTLIAAGFAFAAGYYKTDEP